jgi:transcription initiation factor TFIID subunit 11
MKTKITQGKKMQAQTSNINTPSSEAPIQPSTPAIETVENEEEFEDEEDDDIELREEESSDIRQRTIEMREKMKVLLDQFDEDQLRRYETYRRSGFPRSAMKKFIQGFLNQSVNPNFVIVMSGIAKVYVGEVVEEARKVMEEWGNDGALLPSHIREAQRRLRKKGICPTPKTQRRRVL